ncbi:hypothetical protein [Psychroflexus montanilacus]|uniref:hypothetical protein n=1 Tax=Psychroflexus montanilacus TaxID=2873598 RepID=UPI001CCD207B|nr:hypothetical protein [Psychroflexus montanilacus]MBZ9652659.1 hypothetical protein [Psychroflexus montanilacus]
MSEIKSSSYLLANTDSRYPFLTKFNNTVHIIEPDTEDEVDGEFFNNCEELAQENKVSLVSADKLGEKEEIKLNFPSIAKMSNLTKEEKQKLENFKEEILKKENFKERFLEYIEYEFGIQNSNEGGLFYNEPIEGGINIIFAHIHDIRQLDKKRRDKFLDNLFLKKKFSYFESETVTSSPKLHFAILKENLGDFSDKGLTTCLPYRIDEIKEKYDKIPTKLIIRYSLSSGYEILVPPILDKELRLDPMRKTLYFFILSLDSGIRFEETSNESKKLTRIYRKLDNYSINKDRKGKKVKNGQRGEKTTELTIKMFKESLSSLKSRTKKIIQDHLYEGTRDWNYTFEVMDKISYVNKNKFLEIPLDRDDVALTSSKRISNPINKILNTKFKIIK